MALVAFDEDRLLGHLDLGVVPRELRVSEGGVLSAAADRQSRELAFADIVTRTVRRVDVPHRPTRLVVSPDGAALADRQGQRRDRDHRLPLGAHDAELAGTGAHPRAAIFSTNAALLFVGADTFQGVAAYPFGGYLLLSDPDAGTVTIASVDPLQPGPLLVAAAGVSTADSAWIDTVALVPNPPAHEVLLYDLDAGRNAGAIALAGRPGLTSPEGDKFYLSVADSGEVVVIDTRDRRQVSTISVGGAPVRAVIAGGYGICH